MKKLIYVLTTASLLVACGQCGQEKKGESARQGKGGVYYGGAFRLNEVQDFRSLYPLDITEVVGHRITNQVYEGLVKLSQKDLTIEPGIAERWMVNDSATIYTFFLRKGVKFHDDPCFPQGKGREVTARDFKWCFDMVCTNDPNNQGFWVFRDRVAGALDYFNSTKAGKPLEGGVKGVKVLDDYTLQINLNYSFAGFLQILATPFCWVFPKEAYEHYGIELRAHCVGTGPFIVKTVKEGEAVILVRNEHYWGTDEQGNKLPFLDAIKFSFLKEKKAELLEFRKGNLDMVFELPFEHISEVMGELEKAGKDGASFELQVSPALAIHYYGFQHLKELNMKMAKAELFSNKKIRQAFNYAIDRKNLVTYTLQGEGIPGIYGIVPPAFKDYDFAKVQGFGFEPERARALMSEAGYPNGKGFPKVTLQLNSGGTRNIQIAEVIQKMLKENINVDVELNVMPWAQHLEALETGKALFWRTGWIADYPDPENFLNLLYSVHIPDKPDEKSYINSVRYRSARFDSVFQLALRSIDRKKRFELYQQADQIAMDDAAIMPIYYYEHYRLLGLNVRGFPINPMEYRDMSTIYFMPQEMVAKEKEEQTRRRPHPARRGS